MKNSMSWSNIICRSRLIKSQGHPIDVPQNFKCANIHGRKKSTDLCLMLFHIYHELHMGSCCFWSELNIKAVWDIWSRWACVDRGVRVICSVLQKVLHWTQRQNVQSSLEILTKGGYLQNISWQYWQNQSNNSITQSLSRRSSRVCVRLSASW